MALGFTLCHTEFKSDQGVQYKITIYDAQSGFDLNLALTCGADGFVLNYDGKGKKRYNYIQASKVNFQLNIPSAGSAVAGMIANLTTADAGRYKVLIESSTNSGISYEHYWKGVIVADIQKRKDISYPYFFDFTAVDGLSLMRDVPFNKDIYNGVNDDVTNLRTLIKHICNLFEYYNPTYDLFPTNTTTFYDLTHWYEDSMPTIAGNISPLAYSAVYANAFMGLEFNDEGSVESTDPISAYEMLEQLLKTFGCKIVQAKGYWWIMHIEQNAHLTDGFLYYRRFSREGFQLGSGTLPDTYFVKELGSVSDAHDCVKLSGAIYSHLPKVQEYRATYSNWTTSGLYSATETLAVWPGTTTAAAALNNIGFVVNVPGCGINITQRLQYRRKAGSTYQSPYDYLYVKYILKVGSHYWNGAAWQLNATSFNSNSSFVESYATFSYQDLGEYPQASFQTTEFPASGDVLFRAFYYESAWYADNYIIDYEIRQLANTSSNPSAVQFTVNESTDVSRTFSSSNDSTIANTIENLGECLLGDGPTTDTPSWGRLRINNGSTWLNTIEENWQAWEAGSQGRITSIFCQQALFGQNNFIPLNEYNVFLRNQEAHSFNPTIVFDDNTSGGIRMVCQGYKFNAAKDEVSGEYWKADQDNTGVNNFLDTLTAEQGELGELF
tara:strand:+ start:345 stop:2342 length:1998 start_codon:yes stop_codon:yes gene_type:complete